MFLFGDRMQLGWPGGRHLPALMAIVGHYSKYKAESEVLFGRDAMFTVIEVREEKGVTKVIMEEFLGR